MQRMPARVFAYVLASDAQTHTAAELAEGLQVSPAAISGAVRLLVDMSMLVRDRAPGDRVDHYRIYSDDIWMTVVGRQESMYRHIDTLLSNGLRTLAPGPGHRRVHETREFYRFVESQFDTLATRWEAHRAALRTSREPVRSASGE
ncbi:MarR family transcriptional regulator [Jiangella anatolica]|uniref:MarR family transcriptional regulator n=2 Tax=Jiangella anatolica TaxID=2670374 RepID=A0A2W2B9R9_9ACTN|nr:MarR family transcriptional regulator [Jiangella anatolica]